MNKSRLLAVGLIALPLAVLAPATAAQAAACARVKSDFNGDGHADVAAGAPDDAAGQGSVSIVYDPVGGGSGATKQTIPGSALALDGSFGAALTSGYFDADCYADLAVSAPGHRRVVVLRGSAGGLTIEGAGTFGVADIPGADRHSNFGYALGAGDFNADGVDDLAVGAPGPMFYDGDSEPAFSDGGAVGIFPGSAGGVTATGGKWIMEGAAGMAGVASEYDALGAAFAAGDFNGDGFTDLAIGAPGEDGGYWNESGGAGGLLAVRGGPGGLTGTGSAFLDQSSPGVPGTHEQGDEFGRSLAAGDVTGDGRADLVVGSPGESLGDLEWAGSISILPGSSGGPTGTGSSSFTQDTADVPGTGERYDTFGAGLAIADLNGDGRPDLAVSSPGEDVGATADTGSVTVLYGTARGPSATGSRYVDQNSAGIPGTNEAGDDFGRTLTALPAALVVGAPGEQTGSGATAATGAFSVLTGNLSAGTFFGPSQFPQMGPGESHLSASLS